jgi:transcriptional regulator with PAS, ATPase and Fis domain
MTDGLNLCTSSKMQPIRDLISKVAGTNTTVLVRGESGVGKEVVAKAIHKASPRAQKQFLKVNCAALPGELLESELFGHEKGAFTGAYRQKPGKFEAADGGTLLLDEIGEVPLRLQAKLLHVLQDGEFSRVGGEKIIDTDVRLIASTNRDLEAAMRSHQFREDLYYRLNVIPIHIPPLRERRDDIMPLARHFVLDANTRFHKSIKGFAPDAERLMLGYQWPGNVRELRNLIERLVILGGSDFIEPSHLPVQFAAQVRQPVVTEPSGDEMRTLAEVERAYITQIMQRVESNKSKAAKILGISRQTLRKKLMEE